MMEHELFNKIQADLAEQVKAAYAKPKPQDFPWSCPPGGTLQDAAVKMALAAYRRAVPRARAFAVDRERAWEFAAQAVAVARAGQNVAKVFAQLAEIIGLAL